MRIHFAAAVAAVCLTAVVFTASGRSTPGRSSTPASQSSGKQQTGGHGIFDIATSSRTPSSQQQSLGQSRTATASPFGTTAPRKASDRRWKASCKIADCVQNKAIPPNANLSFSGKVTDVVSDGRFTIIKLFDSVSVKLENGAQGDVPVMFTVVLDAETAAGSTYQENARKSFTVDSNYAYMVWDDDGCFVRAVHNVLTEQDDSPAATNTKR